MSHLISIGECMVELARAGGDSFSMRVGGDTFNTAIYLARLGTPVGYMTALGDDPYSARILDTARQEGVATDSVLIAPGRMPGLYLIETRDGERSFYYWRDRAPAREVFELPGSEALLETVGNAAMIYLSGVTLSLYSERGLDRLAGALQAARGRGGRVVVDSNYRPVGWQRDTARARTTFERFWGLADIALPSFDDEQALWGDANPSATADRLRGFGAGEICIKDGGRGAHVLDEGQLVHLATAAEAAPVDTTAAGDAFNAAYVHARLAGAGPVAAARHGHALAAIVIQHPGAIAPRSAMAAMPEIT